MATGNSRATLLKADLFGEVLRSADGSVIRDTRAARWWTLPLARYLARRERRALMRVSGLANVPRVLSFDGCVLTRSWIEGAPMHVAKPRDARYYRQAMALVRKLHSLDVVHNDLAKEPNWLVTTAGEPALVDFQLAWVARRRGRLFRALGHDDIRHLLKHKRTYLPDQLTARERRILATRSLASRLWMATGKRVYWFITRRILGWADREGVGERRY